MTSRTQEIAKAYLSGKSIREVAAEFDVSFQYVHQVLVRNKIERRRRKPFTDESLKAMADMYRGGALLKEVAEKFDMSMSSAKERLYWEGVTMRTGGFSPSLSADKVKEVKDYYDNNRISYNKLSQRFGISRRIATLIAKNEYRAKEI